MSISSVSNLSPSVVAWGSDWFRIGISGSSSNRLVYAFCLGPNFPTTRTRAICFMPNTFPIELSDIFPAVPKQMYSSPLWCYKPFSDSAWTFDATSHSILSRVLRTRLDYLTASKINHSKDRIWNPVLCSQLMNKLTIDLKSFCLFPLVCMSDSYLKREPDHKSSLHCCVMMKLVYKQVSFPFSFVSFFPYATTCLPVLLSCSCFPFRFSILILSPSALLFVPNTIYIYIHLHTYLKCCPGGLTSARTHS